MAVVEQRFGPALDALARLRTTALDSVRTARIPVKELPGANGLLLLILLKAISVIDSIRILLEHSYTEEAFGLVRTLYDLEIDSLLLFEDDPDRVALYRDYERLELAHWAQRGIASGLVDQTEKMEQAVIERIADLRRGLEDLGQDHVPSNFDELPLDEALALFGKIRFGSNRPTSWREDRAWNRILDEIAPRAIRILAPGLEQDDPPRFESLVAGRKAEHLFTWPLTSAMIHGSPRSVAIRYPDFRVAGIVEEVGKTALTAAAHFARIYIIASESLEIDTDLHALNEDLKAAGGSSTDPV